jgi:hypothetical protein
VPHVVENVTASLNITVGIAPIVKPVQTTQFNITLLNNVTEIKEDKKGKKDKKGDSFIQGALSGPFKTNDKEEDK